MMPSNENAPMATKALYYCLTFTHRQQCQPQKAPSSSQLGLGVSLMANSTLGQVEPGIEPPTFRFVDKLPETLSQCHHFCITKLKKMIENFFFLNVTYRIVFVFEIKLHILLYVQRNPTHDKK